MPLGPAAADVLEARQQCREFVAAPRTELAERWVSGSHQGAEGARQRRERKLALALLDGLPSQHGHVAAREASLQLAHQARLADARVAADQDEPGAPVSGLPQRQVEFLELRSAADELVAR